MRMDSPLVQCFSCLHGVAPLVLHDLFLSDRQTPCTMQAPIARHAGIAEQTLYRWRDEFISAGKQALNGLELMQYRAKRLRV